MRLLILADVVLAEGSSDHTSVGTAALIGAAVGLVIDIIVTKQITDAFHDLHID
ncbi:MAG: hypothetical protein KIT31_02055 [Deltaproteobacteria bacterium]|nr:hypothetical protein [Deltaproteobacteria bacterium]